MRIFARGIVGLSGLVALGLSSCGGGTKTVTTEALPAHVDYRVMKHDMNPGQMERRITALVNVERAKAGLAPLQVHEGLADLSRKHSALMAGQAKAKDVILHINHDGFGMRSEMARGSFGMYSVAENVAANWGYQGDKMEKVVRDWMQSPKHRKNILSDWESGGVGVYVDAKGAIFATQMFGNSWDGAVVMN